MENTDFTDHDELIFHVIGHMIFHAYIILLPLQLYNYRVSAVIYKTSRRAVSRVTYGSGFILFKLITLRKLLYMEKKDSKIPNHHR